MSDFVEEQIVRHEWTGNTDNISYGQILVRCKDCEYSYVEGFVHERLLCEKHEELGELSEDWFCADGWKA